MRLDRKGLMAGAVWVFCISISLLVRMAMVAFMDVWHYVELASGEMAYVLAIHPFLYSVVNLSPIAVGGAMAFYFTFGNHYRGGRDEAEV